MIVLLLLVPLSIGLAVCFLAAFIWAVRSGQYEDTETPSMRALMDEPRHAVRQRRISKARQDLTRFRQKTRGGFSKIFPIYNRMQTMQINLSKSILAVFLLGAAATSRAQGDHELSSTYHFAADTVPLNRNIKDNE